MGIAARNAVYCGVLPTLAKGATMSGRISACSALLACSASARAAGACGTAGAYDPWPGLVQDIFNNRPMNDGAT